MGMDLSLMCNTFIYIGSAAQKVGNKSSKAGWSQIFPSLLLKVQTHGLLRRLIF